MIYIPSYKRSHYLAGKDYFKTAVYVVPKCQKEDYIKVVGKERVLAIPDEADGSIGKKRNWILKNLPRPLVMIDDDVSKLTYTEGGENFINNGKAKSHIELDSDYVEDFIKRGNLLAEEMGARLWGVNVNTDGINYQQYKPISLSQVILGPFQAHLEHDLLFDENMGSKDDYDMAIQQLRKYKKILRLNKYAYDCVHGDNQGGIVSMRTMQSEEQACKKIMAKWGTDIIKYKIPATKMTDLLNAQKARVPIKGV